MIDVLQTSWGDTRISAASVLGELGTDSRSAAPALRAALTDKSSYLRVAAARALWHIEREASLVLPALIEGLNDVNLPQEQELAAVALGEIGREAKTAVPALIAALQDECARTATAEALLRIDPEKARQYGITLDRRMNPTSLLRTGTESRAIAKALDGARKSSRRDSFPPACAHRRGRVAFRLRTS